MPVFKVSVIIPVFNAEKYLRNAVESAVYLEDVGEIILIEDRSPDNALQLCQQLAKEFDKVKVFTHPNGENRGAGASRNLGIEKSTLEYIAFLDADDWYLPNRFVKSKQIFATDLTVDGVYEATGFYDDVKKSLDARQLTTVRFKIQPKDLLLGLLQSDKGRFTTDAITLKKSVLKKSGLFDTSLRLHQDTHLWLKLAFVGRLVAGELEKPVAIRRQHDQNRIQHVNKASRALLYIKSFEWFENQDNIDPRAYRIIFNRYAASKKSGMLARLLFTTIYLATHPQNIKKFL